MEGEKVQSYGTKLWNMLPLYKSLQHTLGHSRSFCSTLSPLHPTHKGGVFFIYLFTIK
ncbi:unnamed protein product, partial [Nesidiocoris tenuis]